jgi:DNA-binding NarL/FixJ family response regulator
MSPMNEQLVRPTRVVIVEDHTMIADGLVAAFAVHDDIEVVGRSRTAAGVAELAVRVEADVVLLDFRLPDGEAPEVLVQLRSVLPDVKVVVVSAASDYRSVIRALEAGASGYLLKDQDIDELVAAVRTVRAGGQALAPALVPKLVSRLAEAPGSAQSLTRREIEVLQLLADGCSTKQLAETLGLSLNTVRNHVQSAINRLGAHSKLEAVSIAIRQGLISAPDTMVPS